VAKILFIEDAFELHSLVEEALRPDHEVTSVATVGEARELINHPWDLMLVDVGLSDGSGFELIREAKQHKPTPFIFLTGRSHIDDKLAGFELGAQDYVTKPFDARELKARVNARLQTAPKEKFKNKTFKIEIPLQRAYILQGDSEVELHLTPIEFKLLYYFCSNENKIINRDEILGVVWGKKVNVLQRTIDKHISSLRQKLGPVASQIETIPQVGYRYCT